MEKRIFFVDVARSIAIILALLDHSMNDFHILESLPFEYYISVKFFTASATPTFIFLFGMMLELVYLKKLKKNGFSGLIPPLLKRSFQCYVGYLLTILAGLIGGYLTFKRAFGAVFFVATAHYGNILRMYTFLLLLAIPILLVRKKKGISFTVLIGLGIWLLYPLFSAIPHIHDNLSIFTSTLFGFGAKGGPSVLNAISIVVVGMLSANFIDINNKFYFTKKTFQIFSVFAVLVIIVFIFNEPREILVNHFYGYFRKINHPFYYLLGTTVAIFNILIFSFLIPIGTRPKNFVNEFLIFGKSSLEAFTIGNILLNLGGIISLSDKSGILGPFFFIVVVFIALKIYNHSNKFNFGKVDLAMIQIKKIFYNKFFLPLERQLIYLFERYH